jgi:SAM-dependent methyltransferase
MAPWIWLTLGIAGALSVALVLPRTRGALWVSTSRTRIAAVLDAVSMRPGELLVDLGCGDGRVLRMARRRWSVRVRGYELNPLAFLKARLLCLGRAGIELRRADFFTADLSQADGVFCYLFPDVMGDLARKLVQELRPGCLIVSCNFALPGLAPRRVLRPAGSLHNDPIYIYRL